MKPKRTDVVSASEIASWAWCPESWRLEASGADSSNEVERTGGKRLHERTAAVEVSSRRWARVGLWLLVVALVISALALILLDGVRQ